MLIFGYILFSFSYIVAWLIFITDVDILKIIVQNVLVMRKICAYTSTHWRQGEKDHSAARVGLDGHARVHGAAGVIGVCVHVMLRVVLRWAQPGDDELRQRRVHHLQA